MLPHPHLTTTNIKSVLLYYKSSIAFTFYTSHNYNCDGFIYIYIYIYGLWL